MPHIIQFIHPGGEPTSIVPTSIKKDTLGVNSIQSDSFQPQFQFYCPDNHCYHGKHKRKFMETEGYYIDNNKRIKSKMTFWGEYEHMSYVTKLNNDKTPRYLHTPVLPNKNQDEVLSTDPFVFCEPFLYLHCRIKAGNILDRLQSGDIILFGSSVNKKFVIDTVFVVKDRISVLDSKICGEFKTTNGKYLNQNINKTSEAFNPCKVACVYRGATYNDKVNNMYSFFPCKPFDEGRAQIFNRPNITLPNNITQLTNNLQAYKIINIDTTNEMCLCWNDIVNQVRGLDLSLGVKANL